MNLGSLLKNIFNPLFFIFAQFLNPVVSVFIATTSIVSFLMAALLNPEGAVNKFANSVIDKVAIVFPSTPNNLKLGYLLDEATSSMPSVGRGIIGDIFVTISSMFAIVVVIKIYKLIPFKAT